MAHGTKFSEQELEAIAAEEALVVEDGAAEWTVDDGSRSSGTTTMSIRLPVSVVAALKAAAAREGVGATVLARQWIVERLADGGMDPAAVVSVADVLALARHRDEFVERVAASSEMMFGQWPRAVVAAQVGLPVEVDPSDLSGFEGFLDALRDALRKGATGLELHAVVTASGSDPHAASEPSALTEAEASAGSPAGS